VVPLLTNRTDINDPSPSRSTHLYPFLIFLSCRSRSRYGIATFWIRHHGDFPTRLLTIREGRSRRSSRTAAAERRWEMPLEQRNIMCLRSREDISGVDQISTIVANREFSSNSLELLQSKSLLLAYLEIFEFNRAIPYDNSVSPDELLKIFQGTNKISMIHVFERTREHQMHHDLMKELE